MTQKRQIYFVINNLSASAPDGIGTMSDETESESTGGSCCCCSSDKACCGGKLMHRSSSAHTSNIMYDSLSIEFPVDFIQTNKPRYIAIKNAKYYSYLDHNEPAQVSVCSDIIQNEKYSDSFLCFCNDTEQYKVLRMYDARPSFYLWLKNNMGKVMDLDPAKGRIFIELLLEF
jgi:hypothetical protein